jgi:Na+/proline symporter
MGMIFPKANTKGTIAGAVCSMLAVAVILIGAQANPKPPPLPLKTDACDVFPVNANLTSVPSDDVHDDIPLIFRLSFMYYTLLGVIVHFSVGYTVSILTGGGRISDQRLLAPVLRDEKQFLKEEALRRHNINYAEIDLALKELQKATDNN